MKTGVERAKEVKASTHVLRDARVGASRSNSITVRLTTAEFAFIPAGICVSDYVRALIVAGNNSEAVASKCRTITRVDFRRASDAESKLCHAAIYAIKRIDALALRLSTVSGNVSPQVAAELADARDLLSTTLTTLLDRP